MTQEAQEAQAPNVLIHIATDGLVIDMLEPAGWQRTKVPAGAGWRIGNPALSYEVDIRLRPRDEGKVRATTLHRLIHAWHQRLHRAPDDPWEYGE